MAVRPRAESDELISFIVSTFQGSSEVEAIVLDGSAATGETDAYSDADFSIFYRRHRTRTALRNCVMLSNQRSQLYSATVSLECGMF